MTSDWDKVVAATKDHHIAQVTVELDGDKSWTYIRCTCGNRPDGEAFTEEWQFTDHIRRLVFDALRAGAIQTLERRKG